MTLFAQSPKRTKQDIITCIEAGLVPFVTSSPGMGKSSIVREIAQEYDLELIDLRLSQCAPEDLMGLPMRVDDRATFVPFVTFPLQGDKLPKGKNGWLLFLDEFNASAKSTQAAAYKVVLDRMVGQEKLHDNVFVVAAGNLATDRAIVNQMSTAMQSRLIHLEMQTNHKEFMEFAVKAGFDHRILGFLEFQPSKLNQFKPDHDDKTFACQRTWEFASKLIKGKDYDDISLPLLAGALSEGVAVELHVFMQEYMKLPSYTSVLSAPEGTPVPEAPSTKYALLTMILDRHKRDDFKKIIKFMSKFPPEFQVLYFRGVLQRDPQLRREKEFTESTLHLTRFLNDDDDDRTSGLAA